MRASPKRGGFGERHRYQGRHRIGRGLVMAGTHKEYKAQKRAQEKARRESAQRRYSLSNTTDAERAAVQLTPGEEFKCLWFYIDGTKKYLRKIAVVAWAVALVVIYLTGSVIPLGVALAIH